eukprot:3450256-Pyramimonas_sp.AAC.1
MKGKLTCGAGDLDASFMLCASGKSERAPGSCVEVGLLRPLLVPFQPAHSKLRLQRRSAPEL